jgi:3-deoxy-manno-octulosonate cytidylyltransferase (CMP-KDO synthetase)
MLHLIAGEPLLAHVVRGVQASPLLAETIVATDSEEIFVLCQMHGWAARMTSTAHRSGTERVHEVAQAVEADVYLNVQGDEPLTRPEHIASLLDVMRNPAVEVGTLKVACPAVDVANSNAVKVVCDGGGRALYFSRATIPHDRDGTGPKYFKHLGFYAYRRAALERFVGLPESSLEKAERLEQLRFLENGTSIYVGETAFDTVGVDTAEDVARVEEVLRFSPRTT